MENFPVTVVIPALNEEHRIADTIASARKCRPAEIIVVEGGSTDRTVEVAKALADRVFSLERFGLGNKRAFGVEQAREPYILNLDADQVLDEGALGTMIDELEKQGFAGIQAQLRSLRNETYWERAMGCNVGLTHSEPRETNMIGTPALFRADVLKANNFNKDIVGSCDDTDLCYRLAKGGHRLGISSVVCHQKHRSTFQSTLKKFMWYGEGDLEFALHHPERFWSIYSHPIRNYFVKKSVQAVRRGDVQYVPFFMFTGLVRHAGFYKAAAKRLGGRASDSRVANRNDPDY